jgi:hypothetical protein
VYASHRFRVNHRPHFVAYIRALQPEPNDIDVRNGYLFHFVDFQALKLKMKTRQGPSMAVSL